MVIFAIVCRHGNSLQYNVYSYERKWNPRCVPNLHCEYQELKPKVEKNTLFLVRHPFSGVDTVKTVGSHLKYTMINRLKEIKETYVILSQLFNDPVLDST